MTDRSRSRGRDPVFSSGRGGAGNIRPASKEPVARGKGPDDFSPSRGRELPVIGDTVSVFIASIVLFHLLESSVLTPL